MNNSNILIYCIITVPIILFIAIKIYKLSQGIFTFSSWMFSLMLFTYIGSILISISTNTYFFVYIFLDIIFYFLGFIFATKKFKKKIIAIKNNKDILIYNPVNKKILDVAIFISFILSVLLELQYIKSNGLFFINGNLLKTMYSTSGYKRLIFSLYGGAFITYALLGFLLYKIYKSKGYLFFAFLSIIISLFQGFLFASKVSAIEPILFIIVALFYVYKKIQLKYILIFIPISIIITFFIISRDYMKGVNSISALNIFLLLFYRITAEAAKPIYIIIYRYVHVHGFLYGQTFLWEIERIFNQLTGYYNRPLFNEIINNLINGLPLNTVSRISAATTAFGVGYANFGIIGALIATFLGGYAIQYFNLKLLTSSFINVF